MIVFVDPTCPTPYYRDTLKETGIGGTEATVIRVAEELGALVAQHCRIEAETRYVPYSAVTAADHLVVLRKPDALLEWHARKPHASPYLWLHDLVSPGNKLARDLLELGPALARIGTVIVCVSNFHRTQVTKLLEQLPESLRSPVRTIYNPVADDLQPPERPFDPFKLVFASQPCKGLDVALASFRYLHSRDPRYRLHVANPGYRNNGVRSQSGVVVLGALPHARLLDEISTAACVFYPNFYYPETFGLIFAESNALGVPVLTYDIGAAAEVLSDDCQLLAWDERLVRAHRTSKRPPLNIFRRWILQRGGKDAFAAHHHKVLEYSFGNRPQLHGRSEFRLTQVAAAWSSLLAEKS